MKIQHVQKLTEEQWMNLYAATYEHNGQSGRWVFVTRRAAPYQPTGPGDAVIIVPILIEEGLPNRLVLEKEFRIPVGDYVYGYPAGLLEKGERIEETVCREMMEETGFEVVRIKRITQPLYSTSGLSDETAAMAFVDVKVTPESKQALEGAEDIEVLLLDFDQVCQLCDDTDVRIDAKVWTTLYLYKQLGRLE